MSIEVLFFTLEKFTNSGWLLLLYIFKKENWIITMNFYHKILPFEFVSQFSRWWNNNQEQGILMTYQTQTQRQIICRVGWRRTRPKFNHSTLMIGPQTRGGRLQKKSKFTLQQFSNNNTRAFFCSSSRWQVTHSVISCHGKCCWAVVFDVRKMREDNSCGFFFTSCYLATQFVVSLHFFTQRGWSFL